jgi:hypothetical protein
LHDRRPQHNSRPARNGEHLEPTWTNHEDPHDGVDPRADDPERGTGQQQADRVGHGELPDAESVVARGAGLLRVQSRQQHHRQTSTHTADNQPQQPTDCCDGREPAGRLLG